MGARFSFLSGAARRARRRIRDLIRTGTLANVAAAVIGVALAVMLTGGAQSLPASQLIHALAVVAAGIAVLMTFDSVRDPVFARAVLRTTIAVSAGVLAYLAIPYQWAMLGFAFTVMLGWTVMDWLQDGANPIRAGLLTGLSVLALVSFGQP